MSKVTNSILAICGAGNIGNHIVDQLVKKTIK